MTEELEKELAAAVDEEIKTVRGPIPLRTAPTDLAAQMQQLERVRLELDTRLRRAVVEARIAAEHKIGLATADFERQLSEMTAQLERGRDESIRQATDELHKKLYDLATMARRQ